MKKALIRSFKIARTLVIGFAMLFFILSWLLSLPFVQNKAVKYTESILSNALGTRVEIGEIGLNFPLRAYARDLTIYDQNGNAFIEVDYAWMNALNVSLLKLIFKPASESTIGVHNVNLDRATINLYKQRADGRLNIAFLTEGKAGTGKKRPILLDFPNVRLKEATFIWRDSTHSDSILAQTGKMNFSNLECTQINGYTSWSMSPSGVMKLDLKGLSFKEQRSKFRLDDFIGRIWYGKITSFNGRPSLIAEDISFRSGSTQLDLDAGIFPVFAQDSSEASYRVGVRFYNTAVNLSILNYLSSRQTLANGTVYLAGAMTGTEKELRSDSMLISTAGETRLTAAIRLSGLDEGNLAWDAEFDKGSKLSFDELQSLLEHTNIQLRGLATLEGKVSGSTHNIKAQGLKLWYAQNTYLNLRGDIFSFTNPDSMTMVLRYRDSYVSTGELKKLLPLLKTKGLPPELDQVGRVNIDGTFTGGISDFVVKTDFLTSSGGGNTDVHFILPPRVSRPKYDGKLVTNGLNVNKLGISQAIESGRLNFNGHIRGEGFYFKEAIMAIEGKAVNSDFWGFSVDSVYTQELLVDSGKVTGGYS